MCQKNVMGSFIRPVIRLIGQVMRGIVDSDNVSEMGRLKEINISYQMHQRYDTESNEQVLIHKPLGTSEKIQNNGILVDIFAKILGHIHPHTVSGIFEIGLRKKGYLSKIGKETLQTKPILKYGIGKRL